MPKIPFQTSPKSIWDPSISVEKFRPKSPKNDDFRRLDLFLGANHYMAFEVIIWRSIYGLGMTFCNQLGIQMAHFFSFKTILWSKNDNFLNSAEVGPKIQNF